MNYLNSGPVKMKTMTQRWKTCNERINSRGSRASVLFASIHEPSVLSQKHLSIVWKCTELRFMLGAFVSRRHFLRNIAAMIREFLKTIEWEMRGIGFFLPFSTGSPSEQIKARQKYTCVIWLLLLRVAQRKCLYLNINYILLLYPSVTILSVTLIKRPLNIDTFLKLWYFKSVWSNANNLWYFH